MVRQKEYERAMPHKQPTKYNKHLLNSPHSKNKIHNHFTERHKPTEWHSSRINPPNLCQFYHV